MRRVLSLLLVPTLSACSLLINALGAKTCEDGSAARCDGDTLVTCVDGLESSTTCPPGTCDQQSSSCGLCGDGALGASEQCDDGNTDDNDGCQADCTFTDPSCGNGVVDAGELCLVTKITAADDGGAFAVAAGDLNGDGQSDLAIADVASSRLSLFFSDAASLTAGPTLSSDPGPGSLVLADLNGDGLLDVVSGNFGSPVGSTTSLNLFVATGPGQFGGRQSIDVSAPPRAVAAADLNGDGKIDLASANDVFIARGVAIFLNQNGSFGAPAFFDLGGDPGASVVISDLNGDGIPDIAATESNIGHLLLIPNLGGGSFGGVQLLDDTVGASAPVTAGDFDRDGINDVAVAETGSNAVLVLLSNGSKTVSVGGARPQSIAVGDLDSDGDLDLVTANNGSGTVSVLLNDATGGFSLFAALSVEGSPTGVALSDLNGDGALDIAVSGAGPGVVVLASQP